MGLLNSSLKETFHIYNVKHSVLSDDMALQITVLCSVLIGCYLFTNKLHTEINQRHHLNLPNVMPSPTLSFSSSSLSSPLSSSSSSYHHHWGSRVSHWWEQHCLPPMWPRFVPLTSGLRFVVNSHPCSYQYSFSDIFVGVDDKTMHRGMWNMQLLWYDYWHISSSLIY